VCCLEALSAHFWSNVRTTRLLLVILLLGSIGAFRYTKKAEPLGPSGSSLTYNATTRKVTAINGTGRFFVGSILTPAATAANTVGNGDGGVGAQAGQSNVFSLDLATPTTSGVDASTVNPTNLIDSQTTTFGSCKVTTTAGSHANASAIITLTGMPANISPWLTLTLNIRWAVPTNTVTSATPASIWYNLFDGTGAHIAASVTSATTQAVTLTQVSLPTTNVNLAWNIHDFASKKRKGALKD
jgi:hypothetical protein